MDGQQRTRSCIRLPQSPDQGASRGANQICIPMTRDVYDRIWNDAGEVRRFLEPMIRAMPELFPEGIQEGYQLSGHLPESKKMPGIRLRQLRVGNRAYSLRPSFVVSYMSGTVEALEHPLLLLSFGVPCWVVTKIFGRHDMFWQRHVERLGRNSLVGTTVRVAERLPQHLAADEHHADWCGEKGYVAVTAGGGCLLGVALTDAADEAHLTQAYGQFAAEARQVQPDYAPQTVNTDGWFATQNTFQALFATIAVVLCFLHGFLKIRDRCRKARELHQRIWEVYRAATAVEFQTHMAAFRAWFDLGGIPTVRDRVVQMAAKIVLEPIFEADFQPCSYGFRPRRSATQALETIRITVAKATITWWTRISKASSNAIDQNLLLEKLAARISDRRVLKLLRQWLRAGVMEDGVVRTSTAGTPQGGVISPLLANVYLNDFDRIWTATCSHLGKLVRYADDFVILCRTRAQAEQALAKVQEIMGLLRLQFHLTKTRLVELGLGQEGFTFWTAICRPCVPTSRENAVCIAGRPRRR